MKVNQKTCCLSPFTVVQNNFMDLTHEIAKPAEQKQVPVPIRE